MKDIYIDLDSTLNNLEVAWLEFCYQLTGMKFERHNLSHWSYFQDSYGPIAMNFFDINPYKTIELRDGTLKFINSLETLGYNPIIISAHALDRYKEAGWKREWLDFYGMRHLKLIVTKDKYKYTKGCILVDDSPKNCLLHIWHNNQRAYLFNYLDEMMYAKPLPSETYNGKLRYVTQLEHIIQDLKADANSSLVQYILKNEKNFGGSK